MVVITPIEINKNKNQVSRSSVILAFAEGMVEPVEKTIYPDISNFIKNEWISNGTTISCIQGFQPPILRNVKPRSRKKFDMRYKILSRLDTFKFNGTVINFVL